MCSVDKELDGVVLGGVILIGDFEGLLVDMLGDGKDIGPDIFALEDIMHLCRRAVFIHCVKLLQPVGGNEVSEDSTNIQDSQNKERDLGQPMLLELAQHELPLGRKIVIILGFYSSGHYLLPPEYRILGSRKAIPISASSTPTSTRMAWTMTIAPARYMS